jgi:hypothetical protein
MEVHWLLGVRRKMSYNAFQLVSGALVTYPMRVIVRDNRWFRVRNSAGPYKTGG